MRLDVRRQRNGSVRMRRLGGITSPLARATARRASIAGVVCQRHQLVDGVALVAEDQARALVATALAASDRAPSTAPLAEHPGRRGGARAAARDRRHRGRATGDLAVSHRWSRRTAAGQESPARSAPHRRGRGSDRVVAVSVDLPTAARPSPPRAWRRSTRPGPRRPVCSRWAAPLLVVVVVAGLTLGPDRTSAAAGGVHCAPRPPRSPGPTSAPGSLSPAPVTRSSGSP